MRKLLFLSVAAAGLLAFGAGQASANVVAGTIYEVSASAAGNATPAEVAAIPLGAPAVTFDAPSTPLHFTSGSLYTIGEFLASGGAFNIVTLNGATLGDTLLNTLLNVTGTVTVATGDSFVLGHDDGSTLVIGSQTVISAPGPSSFNTTPGTYTGPSGNFAFQLVYGECCGAPAELLVSLPLITPHIPEPSTLAVLGIGLLGLGVVRRRG